MIKVNTVLFDLDGTLLPLNNELFETEYFKILSKKLLHLLNPGETVKYIWEATLEMIINNEAHRTNKDVFMARFNKLTGQDMDEMDDLFMDFYRNEYRELRNLFVPSRFVIDSVSELKYRGYTLVVATNPLFPMDAIQQRIKWAGLEPQDFALITSFEEMHFCKPNPSYYREILSRIGKKPEECLMVGNDVEEDLIAGTLGIKTYLIEDNILNKKGLPWEADFSGSYKSFNEFVKGLPYVHV